MKIALKAGIVSLALASAAAAAPRPEATAKLAELHAELADVQAAQRDIAREQRDFRSLPAARKAASLSKMRAQLSALDKTLAKLSREADPSEPALAKELESTAAREKVLDAAMTPLGAPAVLTGTECDVPALEADLKKALAAEQAVDQAQKSYAGQTTARQTELAAQIKSLLAQLDVLHKKYPLAQGMTADGAPMRSEVTCVKDMKEMQALMNRLSQFKEWAPAPVSAANTAISSMTRTISR